MSGDDPWDWSIDRVVKELCTSDRSWQPRGLLSQLPALVDLESKIRHEEIGGCILLCDISEEYMKGDLGLTKIAWRVFVRSALETLRLRSPKYMEYAVQQHTATYLHSQSSADIPGLVHQLLQRIHIPPTPPVQAEQSTPIPNNSAAAGSLANLQSGQGGLLTSIGSRSARGEFFISDTLGNKRRKLDLTNSSSNLALQSEDEAIYEAQQSDHAETLQAENNTPTPIPDPAEINGKKRKRIAPTLISSELDPNRNRDIPTAADNVVRNDPQNIEPGVLFRGDDGRKRLVPIHQPDGESDEPYDYQSLLQKHRAPDAETLDKGNDNALNAAQKILENTKRKKSNLAAESLAVGYLGKKKMVVDDIFFNGIPVGHELSPTEDPAGFLVRPKTISSGRRIYMHRVMKRYLNSERTVLVRDGIFFSAVRPYPSNLTPRYHKPSFTLFYASEDGKIHARREELQSWPEIDPEALPQKTKTDVDGNFVTFGASAGMLDAVGSYDSLDPDLLEKYNHVEGGDEVLPLYGESDEENEYDMETWREIEEEQGTLDKPMKQLAKQPLTAEEVYEAIDEGIAEMVVKWEKHKLPLNEYKAFRIWKKYRPRSLRAERLRGKKLGVEHMTQRIAELQKEIAEELWTSKEKVWKQTRIMEPSIYDREDWTWEIRLLESNQRPEKITPHQAPSGAPSKRLTVRSDDSEGESIDGHSDVSSFDEDLSDFIVDDSPVTDEEKELNLADGEDDEDGASSDVSLPNVSSKIPSARKLNFNPTSKRVTSDDEDDKLMPDAPEVSLVDNSNPGTLLKGELNLPKLPPASPHSTTDMIDLTMLSSDDGPSFVNLVSPKKKTVIKLVNRNSPVNLISDSDDFQGPDPDNLPPLSNSIAIANYSHRVWVSLGDKKRLLISVLYTMPAKMRNSIFALTSDTQDQLWSNIIDVMDAIRKDRDVKGMDDDTFETLCYLIRLFAMFVDCKYYPCREKPNKGQVASLRLAKEQYPEFYAFCQKTEQYFNSQLPSISQKSQNNAQPEEEEEEEDGDGEPQLHRRSRSRAINTTDDDEFEQDSQHKVKRKKKIYENTEARALREQDRKRIAAQEERRKKLQANLANSASQGDGTDIIINESKLDEEGFIYINQKIARRIKKHQVEGVRFMWNQVVADENAQQGCLLAHTMGLGKTMQVITLLVAIAEASSSTDESVFSQIPPCLRQSKTLILCPPGLIDNWMDELLIWAPEEVLGHLRKIDAATKAHQRWEDIDNWYYYGGVLVLGYEMFRSIIDNKKKTGQDAAPINEDQHAQVKMQLTEGPNIIIADEAHKMKNAASGIAMAASLFRSRSRIALTGSPLANNVEEYHTMIEWVAPNYLGPAVEFRAKYVEPIQAGLYHDSTAHERRKSLTMLGVLKEDLSPKVHRADMSVLRKDLPPKKEFVITVPLTELQSKAYSICVKSMMSNAARTNDGDIPQSTLWHWLAILSLLCNHPKPFMTKLTERKAEAKRRANASTPVSRDGTDQEDLGLDLNTSVWKAGVSESLVHDELQLFAAEAPGMITVDLSYKTKILCQILDASKAAGDKVLVFSQSIPTLDFLKEMCEIQGRKYARLDGSTPMSKRQNETKAFNTGKLEVYLISTAAGGLGLNLYGANRVVIFDFKFNPILEEQAVGRAYRIGQKKDVFIYRFVAGGTFEDSIHNKAIFKKQLASRVVDKKNPVAWAKKKSGDFLFEPKEVAQMDLAEFEGMDPKVLDKILASQVQTSTIRAVVQTDTFEKDDDDDLTVEEQKQVKQMLSDEKLKRTNPQAYMALLAQRSRAQHDAATGHHANLSVTRPSIGSYAPPRNYPQSQGAQSSTTGQTLPAPRMNSSISRAVSTTQAPTASSTTNGQPSSGLTVPRSLVPEPRPAIPALSHPVSQGGSSPIMGAGTKKGSDTPEPTSPTTTNTRAADVALKVTAESSKNAIDAAGRAATAQSANRRLKHPHRVMDGGGDGANDKPTIDSEMHRAMAKRPVQSLRTPVTTKPSKKTTILGSHALEDARVMQRVRKKRAMKIAQQNSTTKSTSSSSAPKSTPVPIHTATPKSPIPTSTKETQLPYSARESVTRARRSGRDSSVSSRSTTPKE